MPKPIVFPLSGTLKNSAARFFGCSFDQCSVHVGAEPAQMGAMAFTDGRDIWVDPQVISMSRFEQWSIFGHELTHIVQQRQGRVGLTTRIGGVAANDQPRLEAEADQMGYRFARSDSSYLIGSDAPLNQSPVIQRLVSVGGQNLSRASELPASVRTVTDLIQGGQAWLSWAIGEGRSTFDFPDLVSLVAEIQVGLHGGNLILIPNLELLISPVALLSMPDLGLEAIRDFLTEGTGNSVVDLEVANALRQEGYVNQSQLALVTGFLQQVGVQDLPIFQALGLGDQIAIFTAMNTMPGSWALQLEYQQEAATYAADYASSPPAFADYYQYFMSLFVQADFPAMSPAERARFARTRSDVLAESLRNDLRCPALAGFPSPKDLQMQMQTWFAAGNRLGFSRLSRGIFQLSGDPVIGSQKGDALQPEVDRFFNDAQKLIQTTEPDQPQVAQDGSAIFYTFGFPAQTAILRLESSSGCITLETYKSNSSNARQETNPAPTGLDGRQSEN